MHNHQNPNWRKSPAAKPGNNHPQGIPSANVNFDLADCRRKACKECGGFDFFPQVRFYELPILVRPLPDVDQVTVQIFACRNCGATHVGNDMQILPSERAMAAEGATAADGHDDNPTMGKGTEVTDNG